MAAFAIFLPEEDQTIAATWGDSEKTLMQFCKDYNICDCIKSHAWAWGDVTKVSMHGIWKNTLRRFIHSFKGLAKDTEVARTSEAVVEMAADSNLDVGGG